MKRISLALFLLLTACSSAVQKIDTPSFEADPLKAQKEMCVEENVGVLRHDRAYLNQFCDEIKHPLELVCFRFTRNTRDWRKACPGIDTPEKLECISVVQNGQSYALLESLHKCKAAANRRQIFCLSKAVAKSGVPLQPETVQECLEKNL